ncbi:unnamed protein product [Victoria cruziana]
MGSVGEGVAVRAAKMLGRGFDLTCDFRLNFCKGAGSTSSRLVELDESNVRDVHIPGVGSIPTVPRDIGCDKGDRIRFRSDVLEFNQMSELLNQKSSIQGKIPSGYFNAVFDLSGAWLDDATETKHLAFDGYFISLYNLHLTGSSLVLREEIKKAVPSTWDPSALSRFIRSYGTHVIVGLSVGGQDLICVRQSPSSPIPPAELKKHLENLGDFYFSDGKNTSPLHNRTRESTHRVPEVFSNILRSNNMQLASFSESSSKDGVTIICSKRGGCFSNSHYTWLHSVSSSPDAILFKFVPITSLLSGIPGSGYLSHAINLYLRYKPAPEELRYFLEFQVPLQWAPAYNELPLGLSPQFRKASTPSVRFSFMGPQLHINTTEVVSGGKPVVGLRLYLESKKCNRLAIHVQHLSSLPNIFTSTMSSTSRWQGSEEVDSRYFEPVKWKQYGHVCTAPIMYDPRWLQGTSGTRQGVYIVTGAQLQAWSKRSKKVIHLRLLFTWLPNCTIQKTMWCQAPATLRKSSFLSTLSTTFTASAAKEQPPKPQPNVLNSGVYADGPPVPVHSRKLLKFVDMAEVVRGPHEPPGHWLVIGAKLVLNDLGKISLHVKFALLNYAT